MQGLDDSFDAVFFVGYHGSISGEPSVLSHTYNPSVLSHTYNPSVLSHTYNPSVLSHTYNPSVLSHTYNPSVMSRVALNGVDCGESGVNGLVALGHGVPVALITGDQVTMAEAEPFFKQVEQVPVKESITRFAAAQVHPEEARAMIYAGAEAAVRRLGSVPLPDIEAPARLDVDLQTADLAHVASWIKGVTRSGTRSVRIEGEDPLEIYQSFVGISYITRVAEG